MLVQTLGPVTVGTQMQVLAVQEGARCMGALVRFRFQANVEGRRAVGALAGAVQDEISLFLELLLWGDNPYEYREPIQDQWNTLLEQVRALEDAFMHRTSTVTLASIHREWLENWRAFKPVVEGVETW